MLPSEITLLDPGALRWLFVLPLIWSSWIVQRAIRTRDRRRSSIGRHRASLSPIAGWRRDLATIGLATLTSIALIVAAARPQAIVRVPEYDPFDLIVLLDRSVSMLASDIQPSRLARACQEVDAFLHRRPQNLDRVALVAFAGTPIVTSHLTRDNDILGFFLDSMKHDHTIFYGTDIAATLQSALKVKEVEAPKRRTVAVLLSDGEDHGAPIAPVLDALRRASIPVYSVGVGGDDVATIPAPLGSDTPTVMDDDGRPLLARFSEGTLKRVAAATNGVYYRSTSGAELSSALADIAQREQTPSRFRR
ncbi:MAG TPA: VWA domain-containing protein, partial [Gemmatimonadaceae bacterium]